MTRVRGQALCRGPEPELDGDDPRDAVRALLGAAAAGEAVGVVTVGPEGRAETQTYPQLLDRARRFLTGLRAQGVRPGDTVVLCGLSLDVFFPAFWGCVLGGAVPVAIADPPAAGSVAAERLRHTRALLKDPLVLTDAPGAAALAGLDQGEQVVVAADFLRHPQSYDRHEPKAADTALLMLSSGSTGAPKAVRLTHAGLADFAASTRRILPVRAGDTFVNWLPLDHSGAFLLYHVLPVFAGCANVHTPTRAVLTDPLRWLDLLHEYRAQHGWAPTFAYQLVADALAEQTHRHWDLSGLTSLVCGGEQITLPVLRAFLDATSDFGVRERHLVPVWGMAETVTAITYGRLDRPGTVHRLVKSSLGGELRSADADTPDSECVTFVAAGSPAHGTSLRVVDDGGRPLEGGRIGQLQVHSPMRLTPGYVDNPDADASAYPEGGDWLATGDLAFLAEGQVVITGRRKDVIILNGNNVYAHEIEAAAATVPGVRVGEVAACGIPDAGRGTERLAVFFVGRGDEEDARITRQVKAELFTRLGLTATHVLPVPAERFPRTPAGKVRRTELRDRFIEGGLRTAPRAAAAPPGAGGRSGDTGRAVREELAAVLGGPAPVHLPFYELGLTSVQLLRLRGRLEERLGRAIADTAVFEHPTADALTEHLSAHLAEQPTPPRTGHARQPEEAGRGADQRVAIIGMALRFPGADSPDAYWQNLRNGVDCLTVFDEGRLRAAGLTAEQAAAADRVPVAGVLDGALDFDTDFFGLTPKEARLTHPAHRLFLECCHRALEDGGYALPQQDTRIGVFAGSGMHLYDHQQTGSPSYAYADGGAAHADADGDPVTGMQSTIGQQPDFVATRVAYRLGLTGPAIGVQTACSTSLVAVHLAAQALLTGDADVALAGAAAVHLPQETGYRSHPDSILSPTGRCRAFGADADGTVGGNGVAAVLLKRLDRALADGDTVHAVILGSAVNNDGARKAGYTAPGMAGQVAVVRDALRRAAVPADTVTYVEAHGTGTPLGDPVEFEALGRALGEDTGRTAFCAVGSVKPAIGHLDSCAGMAGLIKTVLMLRHRTLVPTLHLTHPNPRLRLEDGPLSLATELRTWTVPDGTPRRAGVSALGVGGTNAHVILEQAPARRPRATSSRPALVPVSARDAQALGELTALLSDRLRNAPDTGPADVAATMGRGRPHRAARTAVVGADAGELARALEQPPAALSPFGPLTFAFPGQGSARAGMARGIYDAFAEARSVVDRCERLYADEFGGTLLPLLLGESGTGDMASTGDSGGADGGADGDPDPVWPTEVAQPALFAHQAALLAVWRACGVRPAMVLGHSVGEYAALHAGGALSVDDGLRLTARRGHLMQRNSPPGTMLAVRTDPTTAQRVAEASGAEVAVVNGPRSQVLSGTPEALDEAARLLERDGIRWRPLPVDRAFHSAGLDAALSAFRASAADVSYAPLRVPLVSCLDGEVRPAGWTPDASYLCAQARQPVRFDLALATAAAWGQGGFVELGAGDTLRGLGRHCLPESRWLRGQGEGSGAAVQQRGMLHSLGELYRAGTDLDWSALARGGGRIPLPGHPLRRREVAPAGISAAAGDTAARDTMTPGTTASDTAVPVAHAAPDEPILVLPDAAPLLGIREMTADQLGADIADVTPDRSFFELGADSLSLMGMAKELDRRYGVRVPVREFFDTADTPRKLADRVAQRQAEATGLPPRTATSALEPEPTPRPAQAPPAPEAPALPQSGPAGASPDLHDLFAQQLELTRHLIDQVTGVVNRQTAALAAARPAPPAAPAEPLTVPAAPPERPVPTAPPVHAVPATTPPVSDLPATTDAPDFSLYFFGDYPDDAAHDKYALIMRAADFADQHGFHALWFPERHFNSFGALFPNPSVLAAALAARTRRVRLHAGSVVLPLHHPVRVAEEWSVVDNISGGRAGLCFASGWHSTDFALAPDAFGRHREAMYEQLETVRRLWSGEAITLTGGDGEPVDVQLHPRPLQAQPPLYVAVVGNPESYRRAAANDLGVVTNLMAQTVEQLAENIALYRRTRAEHGLDPAAGRVVVLVHTYLDQDAARARAEAYRPFVSYLRSSLSLFDQVTNSLGFDVDLANTPEDDVEFLLGRAYERYCDTRALIGDESTAAETVSRLRTAGADEIACFVDFGVPADKVLAALPLLDGLRSRRRDAEAEGNARPGGRRPLTPAQRRIWFLEQLRPGTSMYHEPKAIRLDGALNTDALCWALQKVADRHAALRTVFRDADGTPYRQVLERITLDCPVDDHTGAGEEEALRSAMATEGRRILDLREGPPLAVRLLRLAPERHLLFLLAHHIAFDSSSTEVFTRDLAAYYRSWPDGEPRLPALHDDITEDVPDPATAAESLEFWRRELADVPDLDLPADRPRPPERTGEGASLTYTWDAELTEGIKKFAVSQRATVFMALTGAIGAVLGRFAGQDHFALGTAVAARPEGAEHAVGLFLDTVPLHLDLSGDPDFATLLRRVRNTSTTAYEHRALPFDELVGALAPRRDPGRNPLFQVMVEYEQEAEVDFDPPRLAATLLDVPSERAPFDLSIYLTHHRAGLRFMVEYDTALFDASTVRRFVEYVEQLLRRALEAPDVPVAELTAPSPTDRGTLARWGGLGEQAPSGPASLHGLFEKQARSEPAALALIGDERAVSYGELEVRANRMAHRLRRLGADRGERVAVLLPRGPELISALLAVLKSGAAYLPLDPSAPTRRLSGLLTDGRPVLLLTCATVLARHPDLAAHAPGVLLAETSDNSDDSDTTLPDTPPDVEVRPEDPAYCIYTSGSTGRPKGVVVPHRGPAALVRGQVARHRPLRTLQWTSPAFDISVQEIFTTLASGAALVLIDDEVRHDPAVLTRTLRHHEVQRLYMPSTPLRYVMDTAPELPALREVVQCGEPLQVTAALQRFLAGHPRCVLYNQYGPTETSIVVTSHRVAPEGEEWPPIGTPVPGAHIRLVAPDGREVPVGAVGEIHVSGVQVAHGYHGRPEETAARFVDDGTGMVHYRTGDLARWRSDGTLEYRGRADDQVKIRGHRVEPAELHSALTSLPDVKDAAVVPRRDAHGDMELVAYVVPRRAGTDLARLRPALAAELPDHLVPGRWVALERLPVNTSGKLDRRGLPDPETADAPHVSGAEPATAREKSLHELWCAELGTRSLPVDRSFFQLGGHSLGAIRLLHRMAEELDLHLSMADFFRTPTIRGLAARGGGGSMDPDEAVAAAVPLTSSLRRLWRRHHGRADPAVYNVTHRLDLQGELDPRHLEQALSALVARHDALRARCVERAGQQLFEVLAAVPVQVPVTDLTAHGDDAGAVADWCRSEASRPFALHRAPLFRFRLARLAADRWVLLAVLNHAICDGWSMTVLWQELQELYNAACRHTAPELQPPAAQFTDVARAEHALAPDRRRVLEEYWRRELGGARLTLDLPYDHPRPAALSGGGALHTLTLEEGTAALVAETAAGLGTTPYVMWAAAFAAWAASVCGGPDDVVLAASSANRAKPGREGVVGFIGDAVLLRARIGDAGVFADLVDQLGGTLFRALDHQDLPLSEVAGLLEERLSSALFPTVLFTVVTARPPALELHRLSSAVEGVAVRAAARNELYVVVHPGPEKTTLTFEYSTDLFAPATIEAWMSDFARLLSLAVSDPRTPMASLVAKRRSVREEV
ncbi:non-ribosomal peptide synthetase/type I polyketide synthase [Streptomyces sp. KN37]|uniref:non-ribosomal peptide synthetase/type I polyketide synthase n=1 Tax=Streptomyces sp. KN37 TaxID=3090667 RepID=UPI002A74C781|nr:non-ribosomal peptide synthetase/type I polyketide synthase [Streptomyces sp. KN37]WPO69206.1 amino acid adenylation domain-containing protein [Streptomyces sp. KN37]